MIKIIQRFGAKTILGSFDYIVSLFTHNKPILHPSDIPFYHVIKDNLDVFIQEYQDLNSKKNFKYIKDLYKVEGYINEDEKWRAEPIVLYQYKFKENAEACPKTYDIISKIPGCCAAMFSVLEPGKYIPPHYGIYKGIYRCLFTLHLNKDADCWIRVGNEKLYFEKGEIIVFDETVEHEVSNASTSTRVALYLDLYRKLPFPLNILNRIIFKIIRNSPFVQNILKEYNKLEKVTLEEFTPADPILK